MHQHKILRRSTSALLLMAAMAVQAQTDYSVYGVADFSYGRFEPSGTLREYRFNSNSMTASFVGVNLKHGFEDGWTPGITLETFIRFQDLETGRRDSDPLLSRKAFASLASNYGTLNIGRLQTFLFEATTRFNAFGNSVAFSPAIRHVFASGNLEGVQGDFYWDRALSYTSPNLEGLTANAMVGRGPSEQRGTYAGTSLILSRGLFAAAFAAQWVKVDDGLNDPTREATVQLGATYNFGLVRLFGQYTQTIDQGLDVRGRVASAGLEVPLGPGAVLAQAAYTLVEGPAVDRKHTSGSLGYVYRFDSVTDVYLFGMDDRVRGQTKGISGALGARLRF
jgi:predicted porin